mmetsp:Transcript_20502/g.63786  ORF Transcript_20502/g.63786 Transcript_20502/m.63786 type:complete len:200 (-) Transcript_20502:124-723(-)
MSGRTPSRWSRAPWASTGRTWLRTPCVTPRRRWPPRVLRFRALGRSCCSQQQRSRCPLDAVVRRSRAPTSAQRIGPTGMCSSAASPRPKRRCGRRCCSVHHSRAIRQRRCHRCRSLPWGGRRCSVTASLTSSVSSPATGPPRCSSADTSSVRPRRRRRCPCRRAGRRRRRYVRAQNRRRAARLDPDHGPTRLGKCCSLR